MFTVFAMLSDFFFGHAAMVEGIIKRIQKELDCDITVVATGGLSSIIARETDTIDIVNADLTLTGLKLVYRMNS